MPTSRPPAVGWSHSVPGRHALKILPQPEQKLDETDRNQTANHSQHRIDAELERIDQLVGGDMKQRFIAEEEMQDHPGCGRTQDDRPQHTCMEVAHDLFQSEQDCGNRRVEGRGQCRGQRQWAPGL